MAEGALLSIISKLVSTIASSSLKRAYERNISVWKATEDLEKMRESIEVIQAVIVDAEKKQGSSAPVDDWIRRVREVMCDVDDLFDEIATDDMIRMQSKGSSLLRKVRASCSKLNPIVSANDLSVRVKSVRKRLLELSEDAAQLGFVRIPQEEPMSGMRERVSTGSFVDADVIIGRDEDLQAIVGLLLDDDDDDDEPSVRVVALVGMMGLGKSTLAQLVYNTEKVQNHFDKRWWACISDRADHKQLIGKIFQSINRESFTDLSMDCLQSSIKDSVSTSGRFLLVLDDLWEEDHARGQHLKSLLSDGAKGSKILVTTRSISVATAMDADHTYHVKALSSNASWELFKWIAFTREQENDPNWHNLGRKILKKCSNNPLAIRSVASLLYQRPTKVEWKSILDRQEELSVDSIMPTLKLSYDYLPSMLKQCFAYCSLFPKDYIFSKEQLIRLWIAQGFVSPHHYATVEAVGKAGFMDMLMRSFFQEEKEDENGEILSCKMHDLIHDLAVYVAREECMMLTRTGDSSHKTIRHLSIGYKTDESWETLPSLLDANQSLRSCLFINGGSLMPSALVQLTRQKSLRAMDLQCLNIEVVPSSIGELKHLRYLNLSGNNFTRLPESITKLVNLLTFDASSCVHLEALPTNFRKLINLRHLSIKSCDSLRYMPYGLGELASLQYLSDFKVGKVIGGVRSRMFDALAGLQLEGKLEITFDNDIDEWDEDECCQIPSTLQVLEIRNYPGVRIPPYPFQGRSDNPSLLPKLARLKLHNSSTIKHLPPLRCFPHLKGLHLSSLIQLEYIEEEQDEYESGQSAQLILNLEDLTLAELPKLKAWLREVEVTTSRKGSTVEEELSSCTDLPLYHIPSFPLLSTLKIEECPMLKSMPLSPRLRTVNLELIREELIHQVLSLCSHSLETVRISRCDSLNSFGGETLTSLQHLELTNCEELKNLHFPLLQLNVLEKLVIRGCPQLKLWGKAEGVYWDSLTNLRLLSLDEIPDVEMLPSSLRQCQTLGKLVIRGSSHEDNYQM